MKNMTPEMEEVYEAGRRDAFAEAAALKAPICGALEPAVGIGVAWASPRGIISTENLGGFCTKPAGHEGRHGFSRQEGQFYITNEWGDK